MSALGPIEYLAGGCGPPFLFGEYYMRVCVFVDGENLRFAICDLYTSTFDRRDYLPKEADWGGLYDSIVREATGDTGKRLRTYWYVTQSFDAHPRPLRKKDRTDEGIHGWKIRNKYLLKDELTGRSESDQIARLRELQDELDREYNKMRSRFDGFTVLQNGISKKHSAIEFRRSGTISYNLMEKRFGQEKTVDVNLAVDMVTLSNNYDLAIIVSGDQDYVPAAQAVKNMGKQVVNVAFKARSGKLLPGGAKQLNQTTDWSVELEWDNFREFLRIPA